MAHLARTKALVQAILAIDGGGVNMAGVVTAASPAEIKIGGVGYEVLIKPPKIIDIRAERPFDSDSPAAARMSERISMSYDIRLTNGDKLAVYELIDGAQQRH